MFLWFLGVHGQPISWGSRFIDGLYCFIDVFTIFEVIPKFDRCRLNTESWEVHVMRAYEECPFRLTLLEAQGGVNQSQGLWAWKHDGILMGVGYAEYRLPRDLAGFEPVTICLQDRPKNAPGAEGGVSSEKSLCWTQTCPSPCWSKSNSS